MPLTQQVAAPPHVLPMHAQSMVAKRRRCAGVQFDETVHLQYLRLLILRCRLQVNFVLIGLLGQIVANAAEAIRLSLVQVSHHRAACGDVLRSDKTK